MKEYATRIIGGNSRARGILLILGALLLIIPTLAIAAAVTTSLPVPSGAGTFEMPFGGPHVTWLTDLEGGDSAAYSGLMTRITPTTILIFSAGDDMVTGTSDDGLIHCFKLGGSGQGCEFIATGALGNRRPLRVNNTTAVIPGLGEDETECEQGGTPDDTLIVLRKLGAAGAVVDPDSPSDLCMFTPGADPIRVNNDTVVFAEPGADTLFHDSDNCTDEFDDVVKVVKGLSGSTLKVSTLAIGADLGVHLTGAPAGRGVRVSDGIAVFSSPGEDGEYADSGTNGPECGADTVADDGLVIVRNLGGTPTASFFEIGALSGNHESRPVMINGSSVVVLGPGEDLEQMEEESFASCCPFSRTDEEGVSADDVIHVVRNLGGSPALATLGTFGYARRPTRVNDSTAVLFSADTTVATNEESTILSGHFVRGIGGSSPTLVTVPIPIGDEFWSSSWLTKEVGIVLNSSQVVFAVHGPPQVLLLTNTGVPTLGSAGGSADDWAKVMITKLNDSTAAYTVAKEGQIGVLRTTSTKSLRDIRLTSTGGDNSSCVPGTGACADETGTHQPASYPVRLSDSKFVVATGGANGEFMQQSNVASPSTIFGGDDGLVLVSNATTKPTMKFVTVGGMCGAPGCKPLGLSSSTLILASPGANGEFDSEGDETDADDELIFVKGL